MVGSLLAQGYAAEDAATLGVFLHGHAGDGSRRGSGMIGMLASDVVAELPAALPGDRRPGGL